MEEMLEEDCLLGHWVPEQSDQGGGTWGRRSKELEERQEPVSVVVGHQVIASRHIEEAQKGQSWKSLENVHEKCEKGRQSTGPAHQQCEEKGQLKNHRQRSRDTGERHDESED